MIEFMGSSFGWSKKAITLEKRDMEIARILGQRLGQCHVLTHAHDVNTQEALFVKIRYDIYSSCFNSHKNPVISEAAEVPQEHFLHDVDASKLMEELGHGPKYLDHFMQDQLVTGNPTHGLSN